MCEVTLESILLNLLFELKWCAVTGARQFLLPSYGKATENMFA